MAQVKNIGPSNVPYTQLNRNVPIPCNDRPDGASMILQFGTTPLNDLSIHLINVLAHDLANTPGNLEEPATVNAEYGFIGMGPVRAEEGKPPPPVLTNVEAGECIDALHDYIVGLPVEKWKELEWRVSKTVGQGSEREAAVGQLRVKNV